MKRGRPPIRESRAGKLECLSPLHKGDRFLAPAHFRNERTICKGCEQTSRDAAKANADGRAHACIRGRAAKRAEKLGLAGGGRQLMEDYGWTRLVPVLAAHLRGAPCLGCGFTSISSRDWAIDHTCPARADLPLDWANEASGNLRIICRTCNGTKGSKPLQVWLDDNLERYDAANKRHELMTENHGVEQLMLDY